MKVFKSIIVILLVSMFISTISMAEGLLLGTKIGIFTKSNESIYVNGQRIQGYLVEDELAICIEDLKHCGFSGVWDSALRRSTFDYIGFEETGASNELVDSKINGNSIVETDIEIFLDGDKIRAYSTGWYSLVKITDLEGFAEIKRSEAVAIAINNETLKNPETVKFEDKKLELMIRNKLEKSYGSLYRRALMSIESIAEDDANDKELSDLFQSLTSEKIEIESLKGIEYLTNLKKLDIESVLRSGDKELLKKLPNLKSLKINIKPEYQLDFLKELNFLEELEIGTTESVKTIGELTNLKKLSIKTEAYDLSPISNLKSLTELSIEVCNIENPEIFKFLKDLNNLKKLKLTVSIDSADLLNSKYFRELSNLEEFELVINIIGSDSIKELSFLSDFTNLTKITVWVGKDQSIKGIESLKNLKELKIKSYYPYYPKLKDITSFKELVYLEKLDLSNQIIDDLEPLKSMSNLKELYLLENEGNIKSLKPLEKLNNLKILKLSVAEEMEGNELEDVAALGNLKKLEDIELSGCKIDDISWIKNLDNLKVVNLSRNNITDISSMKNLKNIERINLSNNSIKNADALFYKENLRRLNVADNSISSIPKDFYFPKLKALECSENKIDNITFSKRMPRLKVLDMWGNNLKTIDKIENIPYVEVLYLLENNISDISFLKPITNLKRLDISHNDIGDIYPLTELSKLEFLGIVGNRIEDITPIYNLRNLELAVIDKEHKEKLSEDADLWEKLPMISRFYVEDDPIFARFIAVGNINAHKKSKTTYKGKIHLKDDIEIPKEGLIVTMYVEVKGHYGALSETEVKEILIPYGARSIGYEVEALNYFDMGFQTRSIKFKINDERYELKTDTDFKIHFTTKNQVIDDCDINILERAKISGKIVLDDEILNMNLEDEKDQIREIAIYARINDEKRRIKVSADVKQKEIYYEVYLPNEFADKYLTLEYVIKKTGFIDSVAHLGIVGDVLTSGFITEDKILSPDIDKSMKILFNGEDIVLDDVLIR